MKSTSIWLVLVMAAVLATCTKPSPSPSSNIEADKAAIRDTVQIFLNAFNAANVQALSTLYADDAIALPTDRAPEVGREAILQDFKDLFSQFTATQTATILGVEVQGDIGVAYGTWTVRSAPKAGGEEQIENGKWMEVHKRQADGSWKVWRWIWNQETSDSQ